MKPLLNLKITDRLKKTKTVPRQLIVIAGPTATGKTACAIGLAEYYRTEIISADSRQFYSEMNIGTAKPSPAELKKIPHHFIGHLSVTEDYDAGKFESDTLSLLEKLFLKHEKVILAGGSGMYIDAVCKGFDAVPPKDPDLREELSAMLNENGILVLQKLLFELDPKHYYLTDLNNPHRLIRALEVCISSGKPYSSFRKGEPAKRNFIITLIGLELERSDLYSRINDRVDKMIQAGLEQEVRSLVEYRSHNALNTVGYRELFDCIDGKCTVEGSVEEIKKNTRNFAKRQLTWFRKNKEIKWFDPARQKEMIKYIDKFSGIKRKQ